MAKPLWELRLERLGERFAKCEPVELSMIREAKPVNGAAHKAALSDLLSEAADLAEALGKPRIKGRMHDCCLFHGYGDTTVGSICFYAPWLLTTPVLEANRLRTEMAELFREAGGALEVVPPEITKQLSPLALALTNRKLRWLACVFSVALQKLPGMPHAEMTYLQGQPRPGCWSATLPNVMGCSADLVDWLIAAGGTAVSDRTEAKTETTERLGCVFTIQELWIDVNTHGGGPLAKDLNNATLAVLRELVRQRFNESVQEPAGLQRLLDWLAAEHGMTGNQARECELQRAIDLLRGTQSAPTAKAAAHSSDFASVNWFGTVYEFTANQAACVKLLWGAWENRTPILGESTILENADVNSPLRSLFRDHPAWGTMIVAGDVRGRFLLKEPDGK